MTVTGIPFDLSVPTSEEIMAVIIDDATVEYKVRIYDDTKIITVVVTSVLLIPHSPEYT